MLARINAVGVLVGVIICLAVFVAIASPEGSRFHEGMVIAWLCCLLCLVGASVALCRRWLLSRESSAAWLAAATVFTTIHLSSLARRLYVDPRPDRILAADAADVLVALVGLMMLQRATEPAAKPPAHGPMLFGGVLGLLSVGVQALIETFGELFPGGQITALFVRTSLLFAAGLGIWIVGRAVEFSPLVRRQLTAACVLATASALITPGDPTAQRWQAVAGVLLALLAVVLFYDEASFLFERAHDRAVILDELSHSEVLGMDSEERLHEVRAGLAGVASAVYLLARHDGELSASRHGRLTDLLMAELGRLQRLVDRRQDHQRPGMLLLDEPIGQVVGARRLAGQLIDWQPSGIWVSCTADTIAEAVSILLVNAAEHAPGSRVRIMAVSDRDVVHVLVSDNGPGVPFAERAQLFMRGIPGPASGGQGIGLNLAHRLITGQGGSLRLVEINPTGGAAFELTLPGSSPEACA